MGVIPIRQVRDGACVDSSPEPFFEEVQPQESWKFIPPHFFPIFANLFEESLIDGNEMDLPCILYSVTGSWVWPEHM